MFGNRCRGLSSSAVLLIGFYLFRFVDIGSLPLTVALESVDKAPERRSIVNSIVVPDAPPEELAQLLHARSQEALRASKTLPADCESPIGSEELTKELFTGVKIAEKLMVHPTATDEQRSTARRKKLTLLYLGAQSDRDMFAGPLYDYVDELIDEEPSGDLAALGAALRLEIRHSPAEALTDDILAELADYTKTYPDHAAGVELFRVIGEQLESKQDFEGARQCLERGIALYGETHDIGKLQQGLRKVKRAEAQAAVQRRGERLAAEAKQTQIKRKLGNYPDGYFVVYAEENVKATHPGAVYFYRYEYEVLQGVPSVLSYADELSEKWSWKLVQRFPEDSEGREAAYDLRKKLLQKKKGRAS